jgi:hypothetical protein
MKYIFFLLSYLVCSGQYKAKGGIEDLTKLSSTIKKIPFKYRGLVDMNNNKPVTLDVIVVYDNSLFSILNNLTAKQYYETRNQLYRDNKHLMSICTWDVLPGKVSPTYKLHVGLNPVCIMIFASYNNESSNHKLIIPAGTNEIMILLNNKTLISPNNGIDYINTGKNKEFAVLETIKKTTKNFETEIPSGYKVFYSLDDMAQPPAIVRDKNLFKTVDIRKANQPLKLETLTTLGDDLNVEDKPFIIHRHSSLARLLINKLQKFLFHKQGIIDNNILSNHGFVVVHNYYNNAKNFQLMVGLFKNKKFFYLNGLKKFYSRVNYGRQSPLEEKIVPEKYNNESVTSSQIMALESNNGVNHNKTNGANDVKDQAKQTNQGPSDGSKGGSKDELEKKKEDPSMEENNGEAGVNDNKADSDDGNNENKNKENKSSDNNQSNQDKANNPSLDGSRGPSNPQDANKEETGVNNKASGNPNDSPENNGALKNSVPASPAPSMGNLGSMAGNLNAKFRWASLLNSIANGAQKGKQALNYAI